MINLVGNYITLEARHKLIIGGTVNKICTAITPMGSDSPVLTTMFMDKLELLEIDHVRLGLKYGSSIKLDNILKPITADLKVHEGSYPAKSLFLANLSYNIVGVGMDTKVALADLKVGVVIAYLPEVELILNFNLRNLMAERTENAKKLQ